MKTFSLLLLLVLCGASPAFGWGCSGHQVVALVALKQLTPNAKTKAGQLLLGQPKPAIARFCAATSLDAFVDLSSWADDERDVRADTADWHFIDIPLGASHSDESGACPTTGCVTSAIQQQLAVLRNSTGTAQDQSNALMFVIHFVGDIHQPLHDTTNNDRGGNCVPVKYFTKAPVLVKPATGSYSPNLHGVWDKELVERVGRIRSPHSAKVQAFADRLAQEFASQIPTWQSASPDLDGWAWESHQLAVNTSYGKLSTTIPVETPTTVHTCKDDSNVSTRMLALHERIGQQYTNEAGPVIKEQLAKAGTRLAVLLNQLWP